LSSYFYYSSVFECAGNSELTLFPYNPTVEKQDSCHVSPTTKIMNGITPQNRTSATTWVQNAPHQAPISCVSEATDCYSLCFGAKYRVRAWYSQIPVSNATSVVKLKLLNEH